MKRSPLKRKTPLRAKLPDGPSRQGENRACEVCGREFYVCRIEMSRGGRYCSRTCMGAAQAARSERRNLRRFCTVCGIVLADPGPPSARRQTCGAASCLSEAKRRAKEGAANPNFKGDEADKIRWRSQAADSCVVCGSSDRLQLHHVVYEQRVRAAGGDACDPRDSLTTCIRCHCGHHHGLRGRIPLTLLREENLDFAFDLLGTAAYDYLKRHYVGEDARLEAYLSAIGMAA